MNLVLGRYGEKLLDLYPNEVRIEMVGALEQLCLDAVRLAREVMEAERRNLAFAEAARRDDEFPLMARVHHGVVDLVQTELPAGDRGLLHDVLGRATGAELDDLRRHWFLAAAGEDEELVGPLMRFLLYQAVRLNVWVLTWREGAPLEASGALDRLDSEAEALLRRRLAMVEMRDPAVRPIHVLVAEALEALDGIWRDRLDELARERPESAERLSLLTEAAAVARNLGAADAALVRNELEGARGGERLESRPLANRCPLSLRSQNATDQRRRRLLARLRDEPHPLPSGTRFIDLVTGS